MSRKSDIETADIETAWEVYSGEFEHTLDAIQAAIEAAYDLGRAAQAEKDAKYAHKRATSLGAMTNHAQEMAKRLRAKVRKAAVSDGSIDFRDASGLIQSRKLWRTGRRGSDDDLQTSVRGPGAPDVQARRQG